MRGKLRDKRTQAKRDSMKREMVERRRISKRDNRSLNWLDLQAEEDEDYMEDEITEVIVLEPATTTTVIAPAPTPKK